MPFTKLITFSTAVSPLSYAITAISASTSGNADRGDAGR